MKKKKLTKFLILQIEGYDEDQVREVSANISALATSIIKIYSSAKSLDVNIAPTIKIHEGNG